MKYEAIQSLLDRYWEGETSLEEERMIKAYFNAGTIDPRLQSIAPMFQAIREEQAVQLVAKAKTAVIRPQMYTWAAAAAVVVLLTAAWWMFGTEKTESTNLVETPIAAPKLEATPLQTPATNSIATEEKLAAKTMSAKHKTPQRKPKSEPAIDEETAQAMAEIKAALALVSSKLEKGRNQAIKGASHLESLEKVPKRKDG